ncbi:uncharacterized protein C12orf40 homolog [Alligator sinensis]|uniref:Uncharacterized protein C12orf40 homolog n=1 Tax=Alligator sinensis TaxID=38654 RepID=A0A3Q0H515_ALLSI|nr:uncharacterized protein C12orf40 homolog [Alligator sinensis]
MNWVGGSRSRIILKQERRKQKEFFEKKKLRSKMKLLGVSSSPKSSRVSLDLLNLYVVNQIASKKDNTDSIRKPVYVDMSRGIKIPVKRYNMELPVSPQRASYKTNLDDIQNRAQQQVLDNRRKHLSDKTKYQPQLSQAMESTCTDCSTEPQYNVAAAADYSSCPQSSSVSWSSKCKQFPEQNFSTNLFLPFSQPGNINCQDPWISNSKNSQCIFNESDTTVPGALFSHLHSPGYMNSAGKSPALITGNDSISGNRIKESLFDIVEETAIPNTTQDETSHSILALFKDESKLIHNTPSKKHCSSFVNQSSINQLFTGHDNTNQMFNRCSLYDIKEVYHKTDCAERCTVGRCLKGIFTVPEQNFFQRNNNSSTSHKQKEKSNKSYLKECLEGQYYFTPSEIQENPAKYERLEEENGNLEMSSKLEEMQKDTESSLSSQSPCYSPKLTESCVNTGSEMSEEEEPAEKKKCLYENSFHRNKANPSAASTNKGPECSSLTDSMPFLPGNSLAVKAARISQQKEAILQATQEENKGLAVLPQYNSSHIVLKQEAFNHNERHDAWSQTETFTVGAEKMDAATQCALIQACSCRNHLSSVHSAEMITGVNKADTAGGQEIPADEALPFSSTDNATGTTEFPPETEYLTLADKMTLDVLNYFNVMTKREKSN